MDYFYLFLLRNNSFYYLIGINFKRGKESQYYKEGMGCIPLKRLPALILPKNSRIR